MSAYSLRLDFISTPPDEAVIADLVERISAANRVADLVPAFIAVAQHLARLEAEGLARPITASLDYEGRYHRKRKRG